MVAGDDSDAYQRIGGEMINSADTGFDNYSLFVGEVELLAGSQFQVVSVHGSDFFWWQYCTAQL